MKSRISSALSARSHAYGCPAFPIPTHAQIAATETTALDAVLSADVERQRLVEEEAELSAIKDKSAEQVDKLARIYARMEEIEADKAKARCVCVHACLCACVGGCVCAWLRKRPS